MWAGIVAGDGGLFVCLCCIFELLIYDGLIGGSLKFGIISKFANL